MQIVKEYALGLGGSVKLLDAGLCSERGRLGSPLLQCCIRFSYVTSSFITSEGLMNIEVPVLPTVSGLKSPCGKFSGAYNSVLHAA
jgi:hypothetical protein